jgi:hypothetical protein
MREADRYRAVPCTAASLAALGSGIAFAAPFRLAALPRGDRSRAGRHQLASVKLATLYLFFATTRVRNEPIAGELISTMSPGFRKRSGAEVLSGNKSLESAAVPAAVPPLMISPG